MYFLQQNAHAEVPLRFGHRALRCLNPQVLQMATQGMRFVGCLMVLES